MVRLGLRAVEHVVGRERDQVRAAPPRRLHHEAHVPSALTRKARSRSVSHASTAVIAAQCTIASGCTRADRRRARRRGRRRRARRGRGRRPRAPSARFDDLAADHAAGTGDQDAHAQVTSTRRSRRPARARAAVPTRRGSPRTTRPSRRSPASKPTCGSQPSSARIFDESSR